MNVLSLFPPLSLMSGLPFQDHPQSITLVTQTALSSRRPDQ